MRFLLCLLPLLSCATVARADFFTRAVLGERDNGASEFGNELYPDTAAPGSATVRDTDYYFAGSYPLPVGAVAADEAWGNFEKALTSGSNVTRVHFSLTPAQALPTARWRVAGNWVWGGWWDAAANQSGVGFGTHTTEVRLNGVLVSSQTGITAARPWLLAFNQAAVSGDNVLELRRTGGTANGWIHLDYLEVEIDPTATRDDDADGLPAWWERENGLSDTLAADAAADPDRDGRTTLAEFAADTDPKLPDTDADGLSDGEEAAAGSDPLVADMDGDTLTDGAEVHGQPPTSPLQRDADNDGAWDNEELAAGTDPASAASVPWRFPDTIGVQFVVDVRPESALQPREIAGVVPQNRWNIPEPVYLWAPRSGTQMTLTGPVPGALANGAGTASGVTLAWSSPGAYFSGNGDSPDGRLLDGFLSTRNGQPVTLSFGAIPWAGYDVYVYFGSSSLVSGSVRVNGSAATEVHYNAQSVPPHRGFTEVTGASATPPRRGNYARFKGLSGAACSIVLDSDTYDTGLHAVQIVRTDSDADSDGLPDWWEVKYRLNPQSAADAGQDPDGDSLTNLQEFARGASPRLADTDGDGLSDAVESGTGVFVSGADTGSSPVNADTDGDGLSDGAERTGVFLTNPLLADSDADGQSDAAEIAAGTDPANAAITTALLPVYQAGPPRRWTWEVSNVQLVWDHGAGSLTQGIYGEDPLLRLTTDNSLTGGWNELGMDLIASDAGLSWRFRCGNAGAFHHGPTGHAEWGIWDDNPAADLTGALGFSGRGACDISDRLRLRMTAVRSATANVWTLVYEIMNLDTGVPAITRTFASMGAVASVDNGSAVWVSSTGEPGVLNLEVNPGARIFLTPVRLETTQEFAAWTDTDNDGMPDAWESAHGLNRLSAADALTDSDNDGLTAWEEFAAGSLPALADTDGDGISDGAEVRQGTSPASAADRPLVLTALPSVQRGDFNGNGQGDLWETVFGASGLPASGDADHDGVTNADEALAGTDPLDPASRLWLETTLTPAAWQVGWPAVPAKHYQLRASGDLQAWGNAVPLTNQTAAGWMTQTLAPPAAQRSFLTLQVGDTDTDGDGVTDWEEARLGSDPALASSVHAPVAADTTGDGVPDATASGDYAALAARFRGATAAGGVPGAPDPAAPDISPEQAARFLTQATFGPTAADIAYVRQIGYAAWLDAQFAAPASLHEPYMQQIQADFFGPRVDATYNRSTMDNFLYGNNFTTPFLRAAVSRPDQLRQRVAFLMSQILVASRRDAQLENTPRGLANYYDIFVRNAFGNYEDILLEVSLHPVMGRYLSHVGNQKARPELNQYPDENYARELMQLFTIGLWMLEPDGTRALDGSGQPIPSYDNEDITQLARVFTGLWFGGRAWGDGGYNDEHYCQPMQMSADRHDFAAKVLLHNRPGAAHELRLPQRVPDTAGGLREFREAVHHLFLHPNTPVFVSRQILHFLVTSNPSPAYVRRVQDVFVDNGQGIRGDLRAVVRAALLDSEARAPLPAAAEETAGRLKEPMVRLTALSRAGNAGRHADLTAWNWTEFYEEMFQEPMYSPSVFNFFRPSYQAQGEISERGLVSPEFQITDSFSTISVPNRLWDIVSDGLRDGSGRRWTLDFGTEALLADNPDALMDRVNLLFCAGRMSAASRAIIRGAVLEIPAAHPVLRARIAVYLALTCPEGAVQR